MTAFKPKDITRIAVLGESTAMGTSAHEFNIARGLDGMLNVPGQKRTFEIIDASLMAADSPIMVDVAAELARQDIDVFILCLGNSEAVGPYGPDSVMSRGPSGQLITSLQVWLTRFRLVGWLHRIAGVFAGGEKNNGWPGMEMFNRNPVSPDDPRLEPLYQRYEKNLCRIMAIAEKHDIKTLLCTIPVNLSYHAPFGSTNRMDLSMSDRQTWTDLFHAGKMAQDDGRPVAALEFFRQAAAIDDRHAELAYRMADAWRKTGDRETARRMFSLARDLDTHRLRADSRINDIIRMTAAKDSSVVLADIEQTVNTLDDQNLFVDHVQFSMNGLQIVCRDITQKLSAWFDVPPAASRDALMSRLARTPWSERKEALLMSGRREHDPFLSTWDNQEQMARLNRSAQHASDRIAVTPLGRIETMFAELRRESPEDLQLVSMWAQILCEEKEWSRAASVVQETVKKLFVPTELHRLAAMALAMNGQPEEAANVLAGAGPPHGYFLADAANTITLALIQDNRPDEASRFVQALRDKAGRYHGHRQIKKMVARE